MKTFPYAAISRSCPGKSLLKIVYWKGKSVRICCISTALHLYQNKFQGQNLLDVNRKPYFPWSHASNEKLEHIPRWQIGIWIFHAPSGKLVERIVKAIFCPQVNRLEQREEPQFVYLRLENNTSFMNCWSVWLCKQRKDKSVVALRNLLCWAILRVCCFMSIKFFISWDFFPNSWKYPISSFQ